MTNMVLQEPMVASVVEQVVLVEFDGAGFGGFEDIFQASLVEAVLAVILMHLVKGMICSM